MDRPFAVMNSSFGTSHKPSAEDLNPPWNNGLYRVIDIMNAHLVFFRSFLGDQNYLATVAQPPLPLKVIFGVIYVLLWDLILHADREDYRLDAAQ